MAFPFPHPFPAKRISALCLALGLFACRSADTPQPTLVVVSPEDGDTVTGETVRVRIRTTHWMAGEPAGEPGGGHDHGQAPQDGAEVLFKAGEVRIGGTIQIFLDIVSDRDADARAVIHQGDTALLVGVRPGRHFIIVRGVDGDDEPIPGMRDSIGFSVAHAMTDTMTHAMANTQTGF